MSSVTLCQLCEAAPAIATCSRCGTAVCPEHHRRDSGLCVDCARDAL